MRGALYIRPGSKDRAMLLATLVCSDADCTEEIEIAVRRLVQLDGFVCDGCGHGFVLASVSELAEPGGTVVSLARRIEPPIRRAA